jgi:hypothetical protein
MVVVPAARLHRLADRFLCSLNLYKFGFSIGNSPLYIHRTRILKKTMGFSCVLDTVGCYLLIPSLIVFFLSVGQGLLMLTRTVTGKIWSTLCNLVFLLSV